MSYTVRQLEKLSGVTTRTLHWYDEIGLLRPAYTSTNGRRYYEEEELLRLQQILFFRELGFRLNEIEELLDGSAFNALRALRAHRRTLEREIGRFQQLIGTIDKTMLHMEGVETMKENGFFKGFSDRGYLAVYRGMAAEDLISEAKHRKEKPDPKKIEEEGNEIFGAMAAYFGKGFSPNSEEVQAEVNQHYQMLDRCCEMSKGLYLAYAQLYVDHPDVRKYFDDRDPDLAERTAESMTLYAQRVL